MNFEKIKSGDIVTFKMDGKIYHGLVTSKGYRFIKSFKNPDNILYVKVFEHPEWNNFVILAEKVTDVTVTPEVVNFS
jgi:hypothetical protein